MLVFLLLDQNLNRFNKHVCHFGLQGNVIGAWNVPICITSHIKVDVFIFCSVDCAGQNSLISSTCQTWAITSVQMTAFQRNLLCLVITKVWVERHIPA